MNAIKANSVGVGIASVLGYIAGAAGVIVAIIQSIEENQALLSGTNKAAGVAGLALIALTNGGRHYQAAKLPGSAADTELAKLSAEARTNAETVPPDEVDHA